ncbi:MAG TPA: chromosome segregation protein SMC [Acidimicrobiales bacterium]|nr:chromosome segregation protein SMC [Acidimicrobiales bacterium]
MFLKSLTLKGFKSFADTTTLDFEPGVTVVVGPNGSGKSNIVDAVAWVLGAQGPRTVRSTKMEDVIFAGTPKRAALGRAEVSLTIDNQAGLLPIGFSEVTLTRTLFRSGDSEYAINGAPCRLLDVQELLSDTGVGRQQHVIVSQGQLDAVLNARPEDRRLIIEEAAGILKFRKRKERAERRLEATEGSLLRLQDLLREVRRQIRPLERQADAARRHDDLVAELRQIRRHLAGRELAVVEARSAAAATARVDLGRAEEACRGDLQRLDDAVAEVEGELSALRQRADGVDLGEALSRAERLGATARGLAALIAERRRALERERTATLDQDVVASLEAEAAQVSEDLAATDAEGEALMPQVDELVLAESEVQVALRSLDEAAPAPGIFSPGGADGGPEVGEVRAEMAALRRGLESTEGELGRLAGALDGLVARRQRLETELSRLSEEDEADLSDAEAGDAAVVAAGAARDAAQEALAVAEAARHDADRELHRWSARAEALAQGLAEARARAGVERLAHVDGVVGTLLELVEVDEGWEAAFEAAAGEAVAAIIVDGVEAARWSLQRLHELQTSGAVLPLVGARGLGVAPGGGAAVPLGMSVEPVRGHVRSRLPAVADLLDELLASAVAVAGDWGQAIDVAVAAPGLVVVTRSGDRFTGSGWSAGAGSSGATGAALEDASGRAERAAALVEEAVAAVEAFRRALEAGREQHAEALRRRDAHALRRSARAQALRRADRERHEVAAELAALEAQRRQLQERRDREAQRIAQLEELLPRLELLAAASAERSAAERAERARLGQRSSALAALRRDIEVRAAGLEQRRALLSRRLEEIEARLRNHAEQRDQVAARREVHARSAQAVERLAVLVADRIHRLDEVAAALRSARSQESQDVQATTGRLDGLRRERMASERHLSELRERLVRVQMDETEATVRRDALVESVRRELDCEVEDLGDAPCPELPPGSSAVGRARDLEREIRLMGPINPLAVEEFAALQERQEFLEGQLEDVRSARRELAKVIRAVDAEIVEVFGAAYADVAENFETLFATLFPGGQGRLRLTDPDHLLDTGIEVEARPSGKNIRRLSLLSGGERSLTALALLFAIFRSRPSPFYLMDEVEAALDDVNLLRFLELLREFRNEAQLLVVSHQKRTMEAADWLYGVTMQPGGSSRVISERVTEAAPA